MQNQISDDPTDIKEALFRAMVSVSSQNGMLDSEDREMLVKCHTGQSTRSELDAFALATAKRLDQQQKRPP